MLQEFNPAKRRISAPKAHLAVEALESRVALYATTGAAWAHPELLTISFVPDGTNLGGVSSNLFATFNAKWSTAIWENQILRAAQVWAQRANLNFTVVSDSGASSGSGSYVQGDPTMGDIRIGGFNFGSSTLATGYLPPPSNSYSIAGDIDFNTGQTWAVGGTYDLFTVAAHEFGHALGMTHSTVANAVMYGTYNTRKSDLNSDDIAGIQSVYGARAADRYDSGTGNNSFGAAADITSLINSASRTALVTNLDMTSTADLDYYTFTVPTGAASSFTVDVQSNGLSLLCPTLTVYAADQSTVLGTISGANRTGNTLALTVTNVSAGQRFYVKVGAADSSAFGTGAYALSLNFGSGATPTATSPNTQTAVSSSPSTGGGQANDTLLPNNVVTSTVLGVTNLVSGNLVPGPGTNPHGPGCACPLCRNGGYAPAATTPSTITPAVERADISSATNSLSHSMGTDPSLGALSVAIAASSQDSTRNHNGTTPVGPNMPATGVAATIVLPAVASPQLAITPASSGNDREVTDGQLPAEATANPDSFGTITLDPASVSTLPAAGLDSSTGEASFIEFWKDPVFLSEFQEDSSAIAHTGADGNLGTVDGDDGTWHIAAGMAALIGLDQRMFKVNQEQRRRLDQNKPLNERRRNPRFPCWLNSYCWPLGKPPIERCQSVAQDMSTGGAKLVLRRPFDEGTVLVMELRGVGSDTRRCVVARVVHVLESSPGVWELGCAFAEVVDEDCVHKLLLGGLQAQALSALAPPEWHTQ